MDRLRDDNVQEILGPWAKWGPRSDESRGTQVFLCGNPDDFSNFPTADFHQIWSQYVNLCPIEECRKTFSKIFILGLICPKKPQN